MALPAGWTASDQGGQVVYTREEPTITEQTAESRAALQDTRDKIVDLYNQVGETYTGLVNAGREEEAASLRDAAERFARAGNQTGTSADERVASLQELGGSLRVAGQRAEGEIEAQGINQTLDILRTLANIDQSAISDSFKEALTISSRQSSRNPMVSTSQNTRSKRSRSPLNITSQTGKKTSSTKDNPYFQWLREAKLDASNRREMQAFSERTNRSQERFKDWDKPFGDTSPRQWGEKLAPQSASGGLRNIDPYQNAGNKQGAPPPVVQGAQPSPMAAAQKRGAVASSVSPSPLSTIQQGFKNMPEQAQITANRMNPMAWLGGANDWMANKLYNNPNTPFSVQNSPYSFKDAGTASLNIAGGANPFVTQATKAAKTAGTLWGNYFGR